MIPVSIHSLATATPLNILDQTTGAQVAEQLLGSAFEDFGRLRAIYGNAGIEFRQLARPVAWYMQPRSIVERTEVYLEVALDLFVEAAEKALAEAEIAANEVDVIVTVAGRSALSLITSAVPLIDRLTVWCSDSPASGVALSRPLAGSKTSRSARVRSSVARRSWSQAWPSSSGPLPAGKQRCAQPSTSAISACSASSAPGPTDAMASKQSTPSVASLWSKCR